MPFTHYLRLAWLSCLLWGANLPIIAQPADSISQVTLLFAGDIMGHDRQIEAAKRSGQEEYDYIPSLRYISPLLEQADLAVANLEVTLPGIGPYRGWPMFRSPDALAEALRQSGFDLLLTSNNHSNDAGKQGVIHTIEVLRKHHFYQTGTFNNQKERELFYPLLVYKNGLKLAFLNYTFSTNKHRTVPPTLVNRIDTSLIHQDMIEAQKLQPDAIIVAMHWGKEYRLQESRRQRRLTQKLFDWGADLIIGGHPHVVQPIREKKIAAPDGTLRKGLVVYSLGNFISDQKKVNTDGGIVVEVELVKNHRSGQTSLVDYHYIPVWRCVHEEKGGKVNFFTLPVSAIENDKEYFPEMSKENREKMDDFATFIRQHLSTTKERKLNISQFEVKY